MKPHRTNSPAARARPAFTLIELLCVIAIIAVIAAIAIPVIGNALTWANKSKCQANMRALGGGFALFLADNNNRYPGGGAGGGTSNNANAGGLRAINRVSVYMDLPSHTSYLKTGDQNEITVHTRDYAAHMPSLHCPNTDPDVYVRVAGRNWTLGLYGTNPNICYATSTEYNVWGANADEIANPSRTVLMGERYAGGGSRTGDDSVNGGTGLHTSGYYPNLMNGLAANHESHGDPMVGRGTSHVLFCDGHVGVVTLEDLKPWPGRMLKFTKE